MNWSNNSAAVVIIIGALAITAGGAAAIAILIQMFRQGGWKLVLFGVGVGLVCGIGVFVLFRVNHPPPAAPRDVINAAPSEVKSRPRENGPTD